MPFYCLMTKSRQERTAIQHLENQGYEVYFPLVLSDKRTKSTEYEFAFRNYGFINLVPGKDDFRPIKSTRGVISLIPRINPFPVPQRLIDELRAREDENGIHRPNRIDYEPGDKVMLNDGPWENIEGIFHKPAGERVIILLNMLGESSKITTNRCNISPIY